MKYLLAALAVLAAPAVASASSIAPGDLYGNNFTLTTGGYVSYSFTATDALTVSEVAVAGTGFSNAGLESVAFGLLGSDIAHAFDMIEPGNEPDTFGAIGFIEGLTVAAGETFAFYFTKGTGANPANMAFSFETAEVDAPAPVPLPAAGGLLALALAGFGAVAARKRR